MQQVKIECPKCLSAMNAPAHLTGFVLECSNCTEKFYFVPDNLDVLTKKKVALQNPQKAHKKPDKTTEDDVSDNCNIDKTDKTDLTSEDKTENGKEVEKVQNVLTQRNEGLFLSVTSIFGVLLITISLFLPAIVVGQDKYLSFFKSAFDIQQLGVVLSIISPERFLFFLIALVPLLGVVSIIIDVKNIVQKRIGIIFYRLLMLGVTFGYFALAIVLMLGGGLNFETDSYFRLLVEQSYESDGLGDVFNNVFGPGVWFLLGGIFVILTVTLFDIKKLMKRKKIEG